MATDAVLLPFARHRRAALTLAAALVASACGQAGTAAAPSPTSSAEPTPVPTSAPTATPAPAPSPTASPVPEALRAEAYLVPVAGHELVAFPSEALDKLRDRVLEPGRVLDATMVAVTRGGDPLGILVGVFALEPAFAALPGGPSTVVAALVGSRRPQALTLAGRTVTYFDDDLLKNLVWSHRTFVVALAAEDRAAAEKFATALIQANSAATLRTVSGRAVTSAGGPVANAYVALENAGGAPCCSVAVSARTDGSGAFTLSAPDGTYRLLALPATEGLGQTWWKGASDFGSAADIVVQGAAIGGLEVVLPAGFVVSGTIRDAAGQPVPRGRVSVYIGGARYSTSSFVGSFTADSNGRYSVRVAPGTYRFSFGGPANVTGYTGQWWNGAARGSAATDITVNANTTRIDGVLGGGPKRA